ncbi:MAG: hypothetical protein J1F02_01070 [Lachnospiraceae bacterium]|nr:hypothetical protein [Lachnospiraceae bacterium]
MIQKAVSCLDLDVFDRIVITIVREHVEKYEAELIIRQAFDMDNNKKFELVILDEFTFCQAETIEQTIKKANITGEFVIKDSDNYTVFEKDAFANLQSFIGGLNIQHFKREIYRLGGKSFLKVNDQGIIYDIIEKKIESEIICIGVYGFASDQIFSKAYQTLLQERGNNNEIFISHVVSYLIATGMAVYQYKEAVDYEDWGTLKDWRNVQKRFGTYFVDIDGVLFTNRGKYGSKNWSNSFEVIPENFATLRKLTEEGAQIIVTTSREEKYRDKLMQIFEEQKLPVYAMVMGCSHACRTLINDFAPTNPYPSACAINIPRNAMLDSYIE